MNKNFSDIFDSINGLHKKYSSKEYVETIEKFDAESKELIEILEKYKVKPNNTKDSKLKKQEKNSRKIFKKNKNNNSKHNTNLKHKKNITKKAFEF